ncbi:MAG: tetratricopeptide repeat protein, partial [bacterium]
MPARQPQHLTFDDLLRLIESLPAEQLFHFHHLLGCRACCRRGRQVLPEVAPEAVPRRAPLASRLYRSLFKRLANRTSEPRETFAIGPEEADAEIEQLLGAPPRRRSRLFREKDAAHAIPIVLRLLERAYEDSYPRPTRGRDLAVLAFEFACQLGRAGVSAATEAELKVRARVVEGYAAALAGRPQSEYDFHFENAEREIAHPDAVEAAVFCHLRGSVRAHERRNVEALALLERAARLYGETGEVLEEALALFEQAGLYARLGDSDRALALFGRAVALKRDWTPPADALREQLLLSLLHAA